MLTENRRGNGFEIENFIFGGKREEEKRKEVFPVKSVRDGLILGLHYAFVKFDTAIPRHPTFLSARKNEAPNSRGPFPAKETPPPRTHCPRAPQDMGM